ncbi:PspA/IM30 family protein [Thioflexithrix psekupsensis]|uniref:Phage shock protein A n=1 Tax=Thioflexithrix psekupsensis TaxID=1570016 RepID=A0A251XC82_9GAMM|nr:PspA/IM30 family protein [Thioflexithrix psekupsensis]OUD16239.1 hypothetical protein TPSD3_00510 [Thioflexithrix psekupsensis]
MLQRIINLFKAFINLFITDMEKRNPEALLELEKENLRKQMAQYNEGLSAHATLSERLMTQVKRLETDERDLRAKINANLNAGNRDVAAQYALRLKTLEQQLAEARDQLEKAELTYRNLVAAREQAINAAKAKIEAIKTSISSMKMQKAMAEMSEMASGMTGTIGSSGDTLDRLQKMVEEERDKAAGRARVAHDAVYTDEVKLKQSEQAALADMALAEFMQKEGLNPKLSDNSTPTVDAEIVDPQTIKRFS